MQRDMEVNCSIILSSEKKIANNKLLRKWLINYLPILKNIMQLKNEKISKTRLVQKALQKIHCEIPVS